MNAPLVAGAFHGERFTGMTWQIEDEDIAGDDLAGLLRQYDAGLARLDTVGRDDLEAQVEHLQALAGKLALGRRMLRIYDEVKFVPPGRRPQLEQWGCVVRGHEVKGAERASLIHFDLQRRPYTLTFREPEVSYEDVRACLDLHADQGALVFSILLELDVNEPGAGWTPRRVDAFVPGDWVRDVLDFSVRLEPGRAPGGQDGPSAQPDDLKRRFGLGRS